MAQITEEYDAVICLAGGIEGEDGLPPKVQARMDTALSLIRCGASENLLVTGGWYFLMNGRPKHTEADLMRKYAEERGIPSRDIYSEDLSHDTIGQAYYTKRLIVEPQKWVKLALVTSETHIDRSERIFEHVYGPDYTIDGYAAPEQRTIQNTAYELAASFLLHQILAGTTPGDDEVIGQRLRDTIPGYGDATMKDLLLGSLTSLLPQKLSFTSRH